jgi:uncharacterized repeat protein (TIGR01451 family)
MSGVALRAIDNSRRRPRSESAWRWVLIAVCTLVLCSCRAANRDAMMRNAEMNSAARLSACDGAPTNTMPTCDCMFCSGQPQPLGPCGAARVNAAGEYLCDGGDAPPPVLVSPEWQIYGLDSSDTVAHYDAVDGHTLVEPSNRVCVYAPRFGAVRVVSRIAAGEQIDVTHGAEQPLPPLRFDDTQIVTSSKQNEQPIGGLAARLPEEFDQRQHEGLARAMVPLRGVQDGLLPYENFNIIRTGMMDNAERAQLALAIDAAIEWTGVQAPQIQIGYSTPAAAIGVEKGQLIYEFKDLRHCPKLRLMKVASSASASPGDTVDFTLRFDNIGDQPVGNIVIVDNLVTRLQYVPDSALSSVDARFSTSPNDDDSLVLRWEIVNAVMPGDGGIVKFTAKVR